MAEVDTSFYRDNQLQSPFDFQNKLLENQMKQQEVQANSIKLATERFGLVNRAAAGLLSDPDLGQKDISPKLWDVLGRLTKGDTMTAQHAVQFMQELPRDPMMQRQAIKNVHAQTLDAWQRGQAFLGQTQQINTGGGTQLVGAPAYGGPVQDRGYISNTLPPTERVPQGDPNLPNYGAKNFVGQPGRPTIEQPQAPQGLSGQPQGAPPQLRRPMPQRSPGASAAPPQAAPVMSDLPGGSETAFKGAADALVAARDAAATYGQRVNPLRQAIPILEKMKETEIGPTSPEFNNFKSMLQTLGAGTILGIDPNKIKNMNEITKYFAQYTSQAAATLGPKTNDGLATAVTSNPNVHMDKLSATDLSKMALGIERARQAGVLEFEAALRRKEVVPGQFGTFMAHWGTEADPRGFVYDLLDGKAQKKMLEGLSDVQKDRIRNAITIGKKYGLVGDVRAQ
jgi:hypothetical protein